MEIELTITTSSGKPVTITGDEDEVDGILDKIKGHADLARQRDDLLAACQTLHDSYSEAITDMAHLMMYPRDKDALRDKWFSAAVPGLPGKPGRSRPEVEAEKARAAIAATGQGEVGDV